jgi:hypothetical protein
MVCLIVDSILMDCNSVHRLPGEPDGGEDRSGGDGGEDRSGADGAGAGAADRPDDEGEEAGADAVLRLSEPRTLDSRAWEELSEPPNAPP